MGITIPRPPPMGGEVINQWDDDPDILNAINLYELVLECRLYYCYKAIL